jgi:hypothetical protein
MAKKEDAKLVFDTIVYRCNVEMTEEIAAKVLADFGRFSTAGLRLLKDSLVKTEEQPRQEEPTDKKEFVPKGPVDPTEVKDPVIEEEEEVTE